MEKPSLLPEKVIIYDDSCPMCKWYTHEFVEMGMLSPENRVGFSEVDSAILEKIDIQRCRHEIPLYDRTTQTVIYGPHALYLMIGSKWPMLKPLFEVGAFRTFIYFLYQIITYNRRIIAGSGSTNKGFDCAPDFHLTYRWVYILLATVASIAIASFTRTVLQQYHSESLNFMGEGLAIGVGIAFILGGFLAQRITFWGHVATVWLIANLIVLPFVWISFALPLQFWTIGLGLLAGVCCFMMGKRWQWIQAAVTV